MKNGVVCGPCSIYSSNVYVGEAQNVTIVINTNPMYTEQYESICDDLTGFAVKPSKHKKGKELKCWDSKRFYE